MAHFRFPNTSRIRFGQLTIIIAATLLTAACASSQGPLAGRVNGYPIPRDNYISEYRGLFTKFWMTNERAPGIDEKNEIVRQTWRNITKDVILRQHFERYKIGSSVVEAIDTLKANPPAYIVKSPVFQSNGVFDQALYQQSLLYGQPEDLSPLVRQYRDYYVPVAKLKEALIDDQLLSSKQRQMIATAMTSSADLDLVYIDSSQLEVTVRDEDIKLYYDTHPSEFSLEQRYSVAYALMPLPASEEDVAAANALADSLFQYLKAGADSDSLLAEFRKVNPLISVKDSGFLKIDELDPGLYNAFASIKIGEYLPPRPQDDGVAIHRLEQISKSLIGYTTLWIPYLPGESTIAADRNRAAVNARLLRAVGYETASDELDLEFAHKTGITPGSLWLDPKFETPDARQPQSLVKGYVPEPVFYPVLSAWLLIQVTDSQMDRQKPLDEVREAVQSKLVLDQRRQFAMADAQAWLQSDAPSTLDISKLPSAQITTLKSQTLQNPQGPILDDGILFDAMMARIKKQAPKVYQKDDYVIIPLIRALRSESSLKADPQKLRAYFKNSLPEDWFNTWMEEQIKKARVSIFIEM